MANFAVVVVNIARTRRSSPVRVCRRRRRRLLPRDTSTPQGTDAGNITSSGPFYGYCYTASAPYAHVRARTVSV